MDVFAIGFVATILFATTLGVWLALRETTDITQNHKNQVKNIFRC